MSVVKHLGHGTSSSLTYAKTAIIAVPEKEEGFPVENIQSKWFMIPQAGGSRDLLKA